MHINYRNRPLLKTLGQFKNFVFVIISTRENTCLIFLLFILPSFVFLLILLLKIVDFEKIKTVHFALKMGILLTFQNLREVN